jgi:FSR family fosmidomycin resistance protein-like MFS transporter
VAQAVVDRQQAGSGTFAVLAAISFCHLLNDLAQSLVPAIYPIFKASFALSFGQIGLIALVFQGIASLLQPLVGLYTDHKPQPYSLTYGMGFTFVGILIMAYAPNYLALLGGSALLGFGASIFHPEASRLARLASGGAHGFAQSLFQLGGSFGSSIGPLVAAFFILPRGQSSLAWFALIALGGMAILLMLGNWYRSAGHAARKARSTAVPDAVLPKSQVRRAIAVLIALIFSKYFYLSSITSYYIFYLMHRFALPTETAQIYLFVFLAAAAAGTFIGGPIGDRFGRKVVIWVSILGVLPFTLVLPYVGLTATVALSVVIGLILSSAFSAIVVYAQELMPGRVGMVSGFG